MNLRTFPSQVSERQNTPEVEVCSSKELVLEPVTVRRSEFENCLVESSINSVRFSIRFKHEESDQVEKLLGKKFLKFLSQRAEDFLIVRRVPLDGFSFSFLITKKHVDCITKTKLIDWILDFIVEVDSEISSLKISQNARGRAIAMEYMKLFA